ncbi:hypothetical protein B0T20DRAFT_470158 [Sordaria brevicollis]|uniref:2EXR domain-containing protein n=1 Tax=Sordaria brevicollis TaxID=83679 RepID=A0AAE0PDK3_SORBR|nr:hypothetical protein B0T20DRAFT_470158 [Sordaria brevicollis]
MTVGTKLLSSVTGHLLSPISSSSLPHPRLRHPSWTPLFPPLGVGYLLAMSDQNQPVSNPSGPLTTFHPFLKLPWELRNAIWELALRPLDRPGAHIFCIEERKLENSGPKERDVVCGPIPAHWHNEAVLGDASSLHITIPTQIRGTGLFEPAGNPSTYMIDGGLWTACTESRAVMEKAFKHQMWDSKRMAYPNYDEARSKSDLYDILVLTGVALRHRPLVPEDPYIGLDARMVPATGYFLSASYTPFSRPSFQAIKADQHDSHKTASPHYLTVLPHQDLIIIRSSSCYMGRAFWYYLRRNFPFGSKKWGYFGLGEHHGIALEYDPDWTQWFSHDIRDVVFPTTVLDQFIGTLHSFESTQVNTIWLVDYRLKLNHDTPAVRMELMKDRKVFYGSDGIHYVEVYSSAGGAARLGWFYTEGIEGESSTYGYGSCVAFIEAVEDAYTDMLHREPDDGSGFPERHNPHLGILACLH